MYWKIMCTDEDYKKTFNSAPFYGQNSHVLRVPATTGL